jgi:DNA adenine methylase
MNKIKNHENVSDETQTSNLAYRRLQNVGIKRPLLRYHGGKFLLSDWILSHFPKHRCYTETFGGAASVLLKKPRSYAEVYNDLDGEIVNLFRVVRDNGEFLLDALIKTPFARSEFNLSYLSTEDSFEQARRTVVRSYMGFGSASASGRKSGFRANSNRSGTTPAHDWKNYPDALTAIIERLRGVVIENRDALQVMQHHDGFETLHYVDPPYILNTRYNKEKTKCYNFEMTDKQHVTLLQGLQHLEGMICLN